MNLIHPATSLRARRERGLSLVELMVALVLGVLLTLAALQLFTTNQRSFQLQQTVSALQEDGQMVIRYIAAGIRNAGLDSPGNGTHSPVKLSTEAPPSLDGADGANDQVVLHYWGSGDLGGADCAGTRLDPGDEAVIVNRYFVSETGVLSCEGSLTAGGAVELLPNVESFQVQYGVDLNRNGLLEVNRYLNADQLAANSVITAIRFSLLLRSAASLPVASKAQDFYLLDTKITSPNDSRVRRVFTTTVQIRNHNWDEI
jgi:type IV pilus assembly protein PilW